VVAVARCANPSDCTTDVWTGVRSTTWANVLPALDLADPEVIWTGTVFVLVGLRGDGFASYVSPDGLAWTEAAGDALELSSGCGDAWLAGNDSTVMFGVPECALLEGAVEQAR